MAYTIGKFYSVPCVHAKIHGRLRWWPLLTTIHNDMETIGFAPDHAHVDARFLTKADLAWFCNSYRGISNVFATLVCFDERSNASPDARVIIHKKKECKRAMPDYPMHAPKWRAPLETKHQHCKLKNMICPHRGTDLSHMPVVNGIVICPAHGLQFRVDTGALVPYE